LNRAAPIAVLGVAIGCTMGAWWLFAREKRPPHAVPSPEDDLAMVTELLDGATAEPPRDLLVAGVDELYLARASDRTVVAIARTPGGTRTLAHLDAPAHGMALGGAALWVTTGRGVEKIPLAGGDPQGVAAEVARPRAVASDGRWVFVVDVDATRQGLTHASSVLRFAASGGPATVLGKSDGEIPGVVQDEGSVYWADPLEGSIVAVSKAGGAPRVLASDRGLPGSLAIDAGALVWVEKRSESLWTMPKGGGTPRRLVQDFAGFANVIAGPPGIFWTNEAAVDGAFRVLTVGEGGEAKPVSPSVDGVDALASDGTRLFWERKGVVSAVEGM
jgi:hypothetical protein